MLNSLITYAVFRHFKHTIDGRLRLSFCNWFSWDAWDKTHYLYTKRVYCSLQAKIDILLWWGRGQTWSSQEGTLNWVGHHSLMRLMVMGETLAFVSASVKVFCLRLRLMWGFITMLDILGSLIRDWKTKIAHSKTLMILRRKKNMVLQQHRLIRFKTNNGAATSRPRSQGHF